MMIVQTWNYELENIVFSSVFYFSNILLKNFVKKLVVLRKYVSKVWKVYSLRFDTVEIDLCAMLSCFTIKCAKHYAPDWFYCLTVYLFLAKQGKYYSSKCAKLMQSSVKIL